jgi:two-component system, sensor histidine kinase and response regulator
MVAVVLLHSSVMLPPSESRPAVLDVSVMAAIRALGSAGEPDVYTEVAQLFLADVPIHLAALRAAITASRADQVEQIAHRLRGGALEMGALRMAPLCAELEHSARAGCLQHADDNLANLHREFAVARAALEEAIQ